MGITSLSSIVKNEIHFVLSMTYGATIAFVGQSSIQILQEPQVFYNKVPGSSLILVKI